MGNVLYVADPETQSSLGMSRQGLLDRHWREIFTTN